MSELVLEKNNRLPDSWTLATIGEISDRIQYGYTETATNNPTGIKFLRISDIQNNSVDWDNVPFCTISADGKPKYLLHENDLVFARTGGTVGKSYLIKKDVPPAVFASYLIRVILNKNIFPKFIRYFFQSNTYWQQIQIGKTGLKTNVNAEILSKLVFQLAPLNEQKRIALKIEELFSLIDFQSHTLLKTKELLISIKKSILKNAFNGNLTMHWRKLNSSENVEHILNKIEKEREKKNLEKFEKAIPRTLNLPESWTSGTLGFLTENHDGKRIPVSKIKREQMKGKYPYYGASGIIDYVNKPIFKGKYLLIGEDGANLLARSTPIAFLADGEFWVNNHAHILKTLDEIPLEFLSYYINSISLSKWVTGTAQPKLNQRNMNKIPIPVPPISEQKEIIKIIEQEFSIIDKQIEFIRNLENHLSLLRMSILKQAFEGKLVPQDPNDEHAEILLEKIKQEKQLIQKQNPSRSTKNVK